MAPFTIAEMPGDFYSRFEIDQQIIDREISESGRYMPPKTSLDVNLPIYPPELKGLLDLGREKVTWAEFSTPQDYFAMKSNLFTHLIIPSLPEDKKEVQLERIEKATMRDATFEYDWERKQEIEGEANEKEALTSLFTLLSQLDRDLIEINNKRSQYHKG